MLTLFFLLGTILVVFSQDSTRVAVIRPGIYLDYGKALGTAIDNTQRKLEGGVELLFLDKFQAIGEFGQWDMAPNSAIENGSYAVDGTYFRLGVGYMPMVDANSRVGLGFRYAKAEYSDGGDYVILNTSGLQPDIERTFARTGQSAEWYEAVFYTDKAVKKWLTAGFTFRLRFMQQYTPYDQPDVMIIPGYGNAKDKTVPAVNVFLKVQL